MSGKRSVRVSGYARGSEYVKQHSRKGTKVKSYTQKRHKSSKGMK